MISPKRIDYARELGKILLAGPSDENINKALSILAMIEEGVPLTGKFIDGVYDSIKEGNDDEEIRNS